MNTIMGLVAFGLVAGSSAWADNYPAFGTSTSPVVPPIISIDFNRPDGSAIVFLGPGVTATTEFKPSHSETVSCLDDVGHKEEWVAHLDRPIQFYLRDLYVFVAGERATSSFAVALSAIRSAMAHTPSYGPERAQRLGDDGIAQELFELVENWRQRSAEVGSQQ